MLGVRNSLGSIKTGDTAELYAALRIQEVPADPEDIVSITFIVQRPDKTSLTVTGQVLDDGRGYYQWTDTTQTGEYLVQAQFNLDTGEVRSVMLDFSVINPFAASLPTQTQMITDAVWARLNDIFDSIDGGPWLRDMTLDHFDRDKIAQFIPEVLMEMNVQMPPTTYTLADFATPNSDGTPNIYSPLLVRGVLCAAIRHMARSYAEQPTPQGAQIVYEDRTRYMQSWQAIYQIEHQEFLDQVRLFKRQGLGLGHSALLLGSKAGRLYFGAGMRTRNIGRGYW